MSNQNPPARLAMSGEALRVAWLWFRGTFGRRWSGYLSIVLLVGLVGGVAMGVVAAARRTQSSFPELAARTDFSGLYFVDSVYNPANGLDAGYLPGLIRPIARLPHVKQVESEVEPHFIWSRSERTGHRTWLPPG